MGRSVMDGTPAYVQIEFLERTNAQLEQRIAELEAENTTLRKYNHLCKAHWESPEDPCSDNVGCTICQTNRAIKAEARLDDANNIIRQWYHDGMTSLDAMNLVDEALNPPKGLWDAETLEQK